jgi:hypothetical protein
MEYLKNPYEKRCDTLAGTAGLSGAAHCSVNPLVGTVAAARHTTTTVYPDKSRVNLWPRLRRERVFTVPTATS